MVSLSRQQEKYKHLPKAGFGQWNFKPFSELQSKVRFLVDGLMELHAPFVVGAPVKSCKTKIITDLAVSLATGGKFLDSFQCRKTRVLLAAAEDGEPLLRRNCLAVAESRGVEIDDDHLQVMACGAHITEASIVELADCLESIGPCALLIDPVKDFTPLDPTSSELKFLLGRLRDVCRQHETTLVLSVHSTKTVEKLGLSMLAGTAFSGVAGGWLLLKRKGEYAFDGIHRLNAVYGGRVGCAGSLQLTIDEQLSSGTPTGYSVTVCEQSQRPSTDKVDPFEDIKACMAPGEKYRLNKIVEMLKASCAGKPCAGKPLGDKAVKAILEENEHLGFVLIEQGDYNGKKSNLYSIPPAE